jgi:putative heme-binding domain-containing protein
VTARLRDHKGQIVEFQQGVWRYHPLTRRFELFCEGGGNSWGLDFDRHGHLLYSTNHGGFVMLHGVQGGYYWKAFAKHGPLHNPHAYGHLDHVAHRGFTGGHVTVGGIVYRGDSFPARFRDRYIAADLLGHDVHWHEIEPAGSSFRSRHGGTLLRSGDTWFAPCDVALGPEGAVYVADWHDRRTAHPDPDAEWDRTNGRIYKVEVKGTRPYPGTNLGKLPRAKLLALLSHPNDWYVRKARRILADRRDPEVIFPLRTLVCECQDDQLALEALWGLYVSGGFNEGFAATILTHRNPHLRRWVVRLLGDEGKVSAALLPRLIERATREPDGTVRSQLACTARRLPAQQALPILQRLALHDEDTSDPHIPLLLWWAVEQHAVTSLEDTVTFFAGARVQRSRLVRSALLPRLVRRLAAEGTPATLAGCARLLAATPRAQRDGLVRPLDEGLRDRVKPGAVPPALIAAVGPVWREDTTDPDLLRLMARLDQPAAWRRVLALVADERAAVAVRKGVLAVLAELGRPGDGEVVRKLLERAGPEAVLLAALDALPRFPAEAAAVAARYPRWPARVRARARGVLLSIPGGAKALLGAVQKKQIAPGEFTPDELRCVALHRDRRLDELVRKHWGRVGPATAQEKLAEVRRLNNDLRAAAGDARAGKPLFAKHCGGCHRLFGEGKELGPDLTHANRKDRENLLISIVDPSAVIRKEYLAYTARTRGGQALTGLLVEQTPGQVTLVDGQGQRTTLARSQLETLAPSPVSLMPEGLLKGLKPQEVRDLFAYLQAGVANVPGGGR